MLCIAESTSTFVRPEIRRAFSGSRPCAPPLPVAVCDCCEREGECEGGHGRGGVWEITSHVLCALRRARYFCPSLRREGWEKGAVRVRVRGRGGGGGGGGGGVATKVGAASSEGVRHPTHDASHGRRECEYAIVYVTLYIARELSPPRPSVSRLFLPGAGGCDGSRPSSRRTQRIALRSRVEKREKAEEMKGQSERGKMGRRRTRARAHAAVGGAVSGEQAFETLWTGQRERSTSTLRGMCD
ncbi:hypothetical protein BD413DRAFT_201104 [Trametes elegans]|nr:hypothetical protein BD413DRAFT_201104 [Trametes elegans]